MRNADPSITSRPVCPSLQLSSRIGTPFDIHYRRSRRSRSARSGEGKMRPRGIRYANDSSVAEPYWLASTVSVSDRGKGPTSTSITFVTYLSQLYDTLPRYLLSKISILLEYEEGVRRLGRLILRGSSQEQRPAGPMRLAMLICVRRGLIGIADRPRGSWKGFRVHPKPRRQLLSRSIVPATAFSTIVPSGLSKTA